MTSTKKMAVAVSVLIAACLGARDLRAQAAPPQLVTLQGRLTNASGVPQNGSVDIVVNFYSVSIGGVALLTDKHTAATGNAVTVTNGIYNLQLGGGTLVAGTYSTVNAVFENVSTVYVGLTVAADAEMTPRMQILASGYAVNAHSLDGADPGAAGRTLYADGTQWRVLAAGTSGQALLSGGAGAPTWGTLGATYGGTGLNTSGSTGVPTISAGAWSVNSALPVGYGGSGTTTAFTQGSVIFAGAGGVYSQNNANFFWDNTNNRLGIGTSSPSTTLHVSNAASALQAEITGSVGAYTTPYAGIIFQNVNAGGQAWIQAVTNTSDVGYGGGQLAFFTATPAQGASPTEKMRIRGNGNVGIAITTPGALLDVSLANNTLANIQQAVSNNSIALSSTYGAGTVYWPGVTWYATDNNATKPKAGIWSYGDGSGSKLFFGTSNNYATGITNSAMTIDPSGYVGIGASSPQVGLEVDTSLSATNCRFGSAQPLYVISNQPMLGFNLLWNGGWTYGPSSQPGGWIGFGQDVSGGFSFATAPSGTANTAAATTTRMFISNAGNVGIATTSPGFPLDVNGTLRAYNSTTVGVFGCTDGTHYANLDLSGVVGNCYSPAGSATTMDAIEGYVIYDSANTTNHTVRAGYFYNNDGPSSSSVVIAMGVGTASAMTYTGLNVISGSKSCTVLAKGRPTQLFCTEATTAMFADYGSGRLIDGKAHIDIDPTFLDCICVDTQHNFYVFLTPSGNCNPLAVVKGATGFDVIETLGGTSNVSFDYSILGYRRFMQDDRLPNPTQNYHRQTKEETQAAKDLHRQVFGSDLKKSK